MLLMKGNDDRNERFPQGLNGRPKVSAGAAQALLMHSWQLPSSYREVYILCEIQGLNVPEVAAIIGRDVAAVKGMLEDARQLMREVTQESSELPVRESPAVGKDDR